MRFLCRFNGIISKGASTDTDKHVPQTPQSEKATLLMQLSN